MKGSHSETGSSAPNPLTAHEAGTYDISLQTHSIITPPTLAQFR